MPEPFSVAGAPEDARAVLGGKDAAIAELLSLAAQCAQPGWDGEGTAGLDPAAVATAEDFVRALPEGFPLPEFAPEPDGSVSLDWGRSRRRWFTLSVGGGRRLAYAWLDSTERGHGVACFDGKNIPLRVLQGIQSILDHPIPSAPSAQTGSPG